MHFKSVLILAPHTDDAELGCGGTMARLLEEGTRVHVAAFCRAEDSLPSGAPVDMLEKEFRGSMERMQIPAENVHVLRFPVRRFPEHRQAILESILKLRITVKPEAVLIPSGND